MTKSMCLYIASQHRRWSRLIKPSKDRSGLEAMITHRAIKELRVWSQWTLKGIPFSFLSTISRRSAIQISFSPPCHFNREEIRSRRLKLLIKGLHVGRALPNACVRRLIRCKEWFKHVGSGNLSKVLSAKMISYHLLKKVQSLPTNHLLSWQQGFNLRYVQLTPVVSKSKRTARLLMLTWMILVILRLSFKSWMNSISDF